jgi:anoctamin-10
MVSDDDFTALRNHYGEKVTLYFAFTQFYSVSLIPLTIFALIAWMFLPQYHPSFAIGLGLWTIVVKYAWERRQRELAIKWGVKGFARLVEQRRAAFQAEGTRVDPVTGEKVGWFPRYPPA